MKKNYLRLFLLEAYLIILSFVNLFVLRSFNYLLYLFELVLSAFIISKLIKIDKRKERFNTELFLIILISIIFYYVVTYICGFFTGFFYTSYSKSFIGILRNIITALILYTSIESIRERLLKNGHFYKTIIFFSVITLSSLEIPSILNFRMLTSNVDILNAVVSVIIPLLTKNIFLTYCTFKSDMNNSLTYQLALNLPKYLLPIFPNLGEYFSNIIEVLLPLILILLAINLNIIKREKIKNSRIINRKMILNRLSLIVMFSITVAMIYLTSGIFRFRSLAIGSGSTTGSIDKGDIVVIDKKIGKIKEGDIIAFKNDNKIIVHRIIKVIDESEGFYKTKGDYNESEDSWIVQKNDLVGIIRFKLKFLGWPTIALSELINK